MRHLGIIKDLARGKCDKAGHGGAWTQRIEGRRRKIYHYSTLMLEFPVDHEGTWTGDPQEVYTSTGNGSVSDQMGMNAMFSVLGMPFYFSRKGGATINELSTF